MLLILAIKDAVKLRHYKNKELLKQEYLYNRKPIHIIADELNTTYDTIRQWLIKFDIPRRSISEATKLAMKNPEVKNNMRKPHPNAQREKNCNWKNGRRTCKNSYTQQYIPKHPYANKRGEVLEHRLVMEKYLRKTNPSHPALIEIKGKLYLRREYIVHHINGIKDDNKGVNLDLFYKGHPKGTKVCVCCGGFK